MTLDNKDWASAVEKGGNKIQYSYAIENGENHGDQPNRERAPYRTLEIQDSKLYGGELSQQNSKYWKNTDKVWIVNGHVEKSDANFFREFNISEVIFTNSNREESTQLHPHEHGKLYIGPCPQSDFDIMLLQETQIQAVISL